MFPDWWADLTERVKRHEGCRLTPYRDSVGVLTIGWGRNLDDVGISQQEADLMLAHDLNRAYAVIQGWTWTADLSPARQQVLVEMCFNLGARRLQGFGRMLAACKAGQFAEAADEMLNSRWRSQVGQRAITLAEAMRRG